MSTTVSLPSSGKTVALPKKSDVEISIGMSKDKDGSENAEFLSLFINGNAFSLGRTPFTVFTLNKDGLYRLTAKAKLILDHADLVIEAIEKVQAHLKAEGMYQEPSETSPKEVVTGLSKFADRLAKSQGK